MSSAIATEQGPVRFLGNLAYAATRLCARQNWLKVSTVPGSRYARPGPAGSTYEVEFSGKKCAYEKSARSIEKFAYGVCGRKFGPCLSSAARFIPILLYHMGSHLSSKKMRAIKSARTLK